MNRLVSSLQKVKTFFFYSVNLTDWFLYCRKWRDCFFTAESEEIVSLLQKVKRLFLYCRKWTDWFLHSRKWIPSFSAVQSLQISSSLCKVSRKWTESKHVLFPQWKVNRLFLLFAKWAESEQKVNMFFFRSEKLTDYFFSFHSEQKVNRKMLHVGE